MSKREFWDQVRQECAEVVARNPLAALDELRGECLLITGGTGFMGTWLAELVAYLNDDHAFNTSLILLSDQAHEFAARAPHLARRPDITLVEQDIRGVVELPAAINWIIHAAGSPDNRLHASDPLRTIHVIAHGTDGLLAAAARLPNLKQILNISSGLVYGSQPLEVEAIAEDYRGMSECNAITAAYAEAKRMGETLCAAYRSQHRLLIVNARPFAFIGPYQLLDRPWAINNFIRDSILGGPIRILGDGETVRSYMYPSDMAWWLLNILLHGTSGLSYNVGSPHAVTLNQLADRITRHFREPIRVVSRVAGGAHLRRTRFVPDVSLAQRTLGLSCQVDLDTALQRTIEWHQRVTA